MQVSWVAIPMRRAADKNRLVLMVFYFVLRAGAIFSRDAEISIDGETSFVDNSATSTVKTATGGGQIRDNLPRRNI